MGPQKPGWLAGPALLLAAAKAPAHRAPLPGQQAAQWPSALLGLASCHPACCPGANPPPWHELWWAPLVLPCAAAAVEEATRIVAAAGGTTGKPLRGIMHAGAGGQEFSLFTSGLLAQGRPHSLTEVGSQQRVVAGAFRPWPPNYGPVLLLSPPRPTGCPTRFVMLIHTFHSTPRYGDKPNRLLIFSIIITISSILVGCGLTW